MGLVTWTVTPQLQSLWTVSTNPTEGVEVAERSVYYARCADARAAGAAPIHRGSPGYRNELDADNDGVACEPYRGW
ncbi:excalibur calcium-binding domain-containing protein [Sphingomonas lenta]|uniref:excalibur calcium-binding domain-containing protein n=1 Tax=Sphingomonas lenta TaxID=1141887 RepID=UPI001FE51D54|nr:excalibur calcium-binding domain-containing protein [Sphingomonas lenta]